MTQKEKQALNLTSTLLVATPQMRDPRFRQAVIVVCGHDSNGAMGLVVNKLVDTLTFKALLRQLKIPISQSMPDVDIHYGGPIEIGRGFVLHTTDYQSSSTIPINETLALTATAEILEIIAAGAGPNRYLLALGYAGWSPGQLESEVESNSWLIVPYEEDLIFGADMGLRWKKAMDVLGVHPEMLVESAGHA